MVRSNPSRPVNPFVNGVLLLGASAVASPATADSHRGPGPSVVYNADFSRPLDLSFEADLLDPTQTRRLRVPTSEWVLESQDNESEAYTAGGELVMRNKGVHMVLWLNRPFVAGTELRFGFRPANTSQGLAIVFFDTMPIQNKSKYSNESSIFGLALPPRKGDYPNYHSGALQGYSMSYYRAGEAGQTCDLNPHDGNCTANLRKNPGFHLVQTGDDLIIHRQPRNGVAFEVLVRREGPHMSVSVDGVAELNWTDTGPGAPLPGGFVGLRHMSDMGNGVYTHLEVQVTA